MGPMSTVGHAQYVLDWMPSGVPGPPCQKEYAVMETEISSLGTFRDWEVMSWRRRDRLDIDGMVL